MARETGGGGTRLEVRGAENGETTRRERKRARGLENTGH